MKKSTLLMAAALLASTFNAHSEYYWTNISAGDATTYAIRNDGTLWTCGWNEKGQLGVPSVKERTATFSTVGTDKNWKFVEGGKAYGFLIKEDGTLWAVGTNTDGVQGTGDGIDHKTPKQVGTDTDWAYVTSVRFWGYTALAIKTDGTLWGWGSNSSNQLGTGNTGKNETTPIQIGTDNNWKTVTMGVAHTMAIKTDGTLWGWGNNSSGQLGNGTQTSVTTPVQIGTDTDWSYVKAIDNRTYAVKTDGTLYVCGSNAYGLLGLNQSEEELISNYNTLTLASNFTEKVISVSGCENTTTFAVGENGIISKIYTVGDNTDGALGDGNGKLLTATSSSDEMPRSYTLVEPLLPEGLNYSVLSSGQNYSLAITTDGKLYAWGRNKGGQLGDDTDVDMLPTSIYKKPVLIPCPQTEIDASVNTVLSDNTVRFNGSTLYTTEPIQNVSIYSLSGALLKKANTVEQTWTVDNFEKGIYLLQYTLDGKPNTMKIVKK